MEAERARMAGEIHDDIVQRMVSIKHRLMLLQRADVLGAEEGEGRRGSSSAIDDLSAAIDEAIASVERICHGLAPLELEQFGLTFALRVLFREWREAGFAVRGRLINVGRELDSEKALTLFRIVQESLSNACEHSGTEEAYVNMTAESGWLGVEIEDAGAGFDPDAVIASGEGFGLLGIRERASMVGGVAHVRSARGAGPRVRVRIPVSEGISRWEDP